MAVVVFAVLGWKLIGRGRGDPKKLVLLSIYSFARVFQLTMGAVSTRWCAAGQQVA